MPRRGRVGPEIGDVAVATGRADREHLWAYRPPRYCGVCGFRLDVQVFPDGVRSSCRECRRRARRATAPAT